jgi:acyl carrier protein
MDRQAFLTALATQIQSFSPVELDALAPRDKLFSSGLIDSLNIVELIEFVERHCKIRVNPTEFSIDNFDCLESIANYVERKLSSQA